MERSTNPRVYRLTVQDTDGEVREVVTDRLRLRCHNAGPFSYVTDVGVFTPEQVVRVAPLIPATEPRPTRNALCLRL